LVEMVKKLAGPILGIRRLTTGPLASAAVPEPSPPGLGAALIQALLKLARATPIALIGTIDLVILRRGTSGQQACGEARQEDFGN